MLITPVPMIYETPSPLLTENNKHMEGIRKKPGKP
jgi:hypothetical protein